MFTVYVLQSQTTGRMYIGQTSNLQRRLFEHLSGLSRYSRGRGPWNLILTEKYPTRAVAMAREKALKTGRGREYLKNIISGRAGPPEAD